ncbi:MAG: thiamine pyrophosphate-requiring protein [Planctomycetota bacterium]|nr:thiamine pyrophosphate-requiring protein [Planctomycetota bacterium]
MATVADRLIDRLIQWQVDRVFGYPGDGINGITSAIKRRESELRFIQARYEELAAFMACAHAKFTGSAGICLATSGPGAIHLLNGLYDAKKDHAPVVAIVGQTVSFAIGSDYQQEVDLRSLFKDVAGDFVSVVSHASAWRHHVDNAMRIAISGRTVTCIIVPADIQEQIAIEPPRKHGVTYSGVGYEFPEIIPTKDQLERAAAILNSSKRPAMLVGAGALHAESEVVQTAEKLGAGIAKALLGKAVAPDSHPLVTGSIGLLGTRASDRMMRECDALLMVGTGFPYAEFLPQPDQVRVVQIDLKPRQLSLRMPAEAALHGDSALTLRALLPLLEPRDENEWTRSIREWIVEWWKVLEARAMVGADPINPQRVFWEASKRLPEKCILSADSGSCVFWYARDLVLRSGMKASLSGGLATMCPGVPYALAAKHAFPDRVAIAFVGDGAMQMLGINGLISISASWREWSDPRLIVCVLNNGDLNMVTWEQRVMAGDAKFETSQDLPPFEYAAYASSLGLLGIRIDDPERVGEAWDAALAAERPSVLEFVTDPNVPLIPPHITFEQARAYLASMMKGDVDTLGMLKQTLKEAAATYAPRDPSRAAPLPVPGS